MSAASTSTSSSLSLKEYLKKYESGADDQKKKKKKKKSEKPKPPGGVLVLDEDPVWAKSFTLEQIEEEDDSAGEEKPQVDEDIEVKRMKRLEAIRSRKPYHGISEDGSGWVSVSEQPTSSDLAAAGGSDLSPPRQRWRRYDTPSPGREEKAPENSDLSPPRQRRRRVGTPSPVHRGREPDSGDLSPPRRRTENISPPRRARNSDLSPPRQRRRRVDTPSPDPQRREQDSGDLSPPRQCRRRVDTPSPEPRRRVQDSGDLSPPRRRPTEDISPPRRARNRPSQAEDLSPPRRGRKDSPDLSPPRNARKGSEASTDLSPPRRKEAASVKATKRTGLLSAEDIRKENEQKKKEQLLRFATMDPTLTGKGAEAVFRDKDGKRISKEELLKSQEEEKPKEVKLEWGKGLAQKREAEARARELELEKEKPFARTRDDPELDKMLKERIRWGDPMAHLVKRKISGPILEDLGDNEKMKESGFIVPQTIPTHSWLKRGIDFTPNRYGIRPGRHWDGVDRSNGYEKELFKRQNEKRATESEAYLWSVSDM